MILVKKTQTTHKQQHGAECGPAATWMKVVVQAFPDTASRYHAKILQGILEEKFKLLLKIHIGIDLNHAGLLVSAKLIIVFKPAILTSWGTANLQLTRHTLLYICNQPFK